MTHLPLNQHACFALYSASLAMTKVYRPWLAALGLTYPQYLVMLALWDSQGGALRASSLDALNATAAQAITMTVTALGEQVYLDSGTLTPLLKKLQTQGLIHRERCPLDERRVLVSLTPAGLALQARTRVIPACVMQASQCSADALGDLNLRLQSLRAALHASLQPPTRLQGALKTV